MDVTWLRIFNIKRIHNINGNVSEKFVTNVAGDSIQL
jgi:hypothetical protein